MNGTPSSRRTRREAREVLWLATVAVKERTSRIEQCNRHSFFEGDDANSTGVEGDD